MSSKQTRSRALEAWQAVPKARLEAIVSIDGVMRLILAPVETRIELEAVAIMDPDECLVGELVSVLALPDGRLSIKRVSTS